MASPLRSKLFFKAGIALVLLVLAGLALLRDGRSPGEDPAASPNLPASQGSKAHRVVGPQTNMGTAATEKAETGEEAEYTEVEMKRRAESRSLKPTTKPALDPVFKAVGGANPAYIEDDLFAILRGARRGREVGFDVEGIRLEGKVEAVREAPEASSYGIKLTDRPGRVVVHEDGAGRRYGYVLFEGDSRALTFREAAMDGGAKKATVENTTVSKILCAPEGTVWGGSHSASGGLANPFSSKTFSNTVAPVGAQPALDSIPGAEYVIYLDFDGELVENSPEWGTINALPHPLAGDDEFIETVWQRTAEDFIPFDITVTTDRSVYDAADPDKRLMVIVTPTDDARPGAGGVAAIGSFRTNSPIVWTFNLEEYLCADTNSHEAGHAFGLVHDGRTNADEYYGGHADAYTPGWAPIMGASWSDEGTGILFDEVTQWSQGEYLNANNFENDLVIIGSTANGFGFRSDDFADDVPRSPVGPAYGNLTTSAGNSISGGGLITASSDVDVFRFSSNGGQVDITVRPLDVMSEFSSFGSNTNGANLALDVTLLDEGGGVVARGIDSSFFSDTKGLASNVRADVDAGTYFLMIEGAGRGNDGTDGFSDYASLGQYFIGGTLAVPPLTVFGGDKTDQSIFDRETTISPANGTDFGFNQPGNTLTQTYLLSNDGSGNLTDVEVTIDPGTNFTVVNPPLSTISSNTGTFMTLGYTPESTGLDRETVRITYKNPSGLEESLEFAVGGTTTPEEEEDNYEENDAFSEAFNLSALEDVPLSEHLGRGFMSDVGDFYKFRIGPNDRVVTVQTSHDPASGGISFSLHDPRGGLLASPVGDPSNQTMTYLVPEGATIREIFISVRSASGNARNTYDLSWSAIELGDAGNDDLYEENDTREEARELPLENLSLTRLSDLLGSGIQSDEDWYVLEVPRDPFIRMFYLELSFDRSQGDMGVQLFRDSFFPVAAGIDGENREHIGFTETVLTEDFADDFSPEGNTVITGVEPGTYFIRVFGDNAGNEYDLLFGTLDDDRYEIPPGEERENDFRNDAFDLGQDIVESSLSSVDGPGILADYANSATAENFVNRGDVDWYRFQFNPLGVGAVEVTFAGLNVSTDFIDYQLVDSRGIVVDSFSPDIPEDDITVPVTLTIPEPRESEFFIRVSTASEIGFLTAYDFSVELLTNPPLVDGAVEDGYEENDGFTETFDITAIEGFWLSTLGGFGALFDPDWYRITIPEEATRLDLELTFNGEDGDIDLTLTNENGLIAFEAPDTTGTETISWENPNPGTFLIAVTGDRSGNAYNLFWSIDRAEDNYEENDTPASAFDLRPYEAIRLNKVNDFGVQADDDYYRISVPPDAAQLEILADFVPSEGDIDLELYTTTGRLIARSVNVSTTEAITVPSPPAGDYLVRVFFGDEANEYDLLWSAPSQAELDAVTEDAYESNDELGAEAHTLGPDQSFLSEDSGPGTQTDEDWYQFTLDDSIQGLFVDLTFDHADGDIDLEVYDSAGSVVARSASLTDGETIDFRSRLPADTYFIRVFGSNTGNTYDFFYLFRSEDAFEENDSFATAADIRGNKQTDLSSLSQPTLGDEDWYRIETTEDDATIVARVDRFSHEDGNVDLELYDSGRRLLASSATNEDEEFIRKEVGSSGDFFLRVFGDELHNNYDLFWNSDVEDAFEENDERSAAYDLSAEEGNDLEGVVFDDDWFEIAPPVGSVQVSVELTFVHDLGDTDIEVFDADGKFVASEISVTDNEFVTFPVSPDGGSYFVRVFGFDGDLGNPYTLNWTSSTVDLFEENDIREEAFDLAGSEGVFLSETLGYGSLKDEDWFRVVSNGTNLLVICDFEHAEGNIDIELVDAEGRFVDRSIGTTDREVIDLALPSGDYFVRVFGDLAGNTYELFWTNYAGDDGFEENDVFADAADIGGNEYDTERDLVSFDDDWYRVSLAPGDSEFFATIGFAHARGDLTLELYDANEALVAAAGTSTDNETIRETGLSDGDYYLRVTGPGVGTDYSLIWSSGFEDDYEENDASSGAFDLSGDEMTPISAISGEGAQYDQDWFRIDLPAPDGNFLELNFSTVEPTTDLTITVYDADEEFLGFASLAGSTGEILSFDDIESGTYRVLIDGAGIGRRYDLEWRGFPDDSYEQNDSIAEAYDFSASPGTAISSIDGPGIRVDDDYFKVVSNDGDVRLDVVCSFAHADGNIDLEILDGAGNSLATSTSTDDNESILLDLPSTQAAAYYIRVFGADESGAAYDLSWTSDSIDNFEPNDSSGEAFDITGTGGSPLSDLGGIPTQWDDDWYRIDLDPGVGFFSAEVSFNHAEGNIDVELLDSDLNVISSSATTSDTEAVDALVDLAGGTVFLRVFGDNNGNPYEITYETTTDDGFEENDVSGDAYDITALEGESLSTGNSGNEAVQFDDDWYRFTVAPNTPILSVQLVHSHAEGNIALELYDSSVSLVAASDKNADLEVILENIDPSGGTYFVKVGGIDGGNTYDLLWTGMVEDNYEENDVVADAFDLTEQEGVLLDRLDGFATQTDDDWYRIVVSDNSPLLQVDLFFSHADGDIDAELYQLFPADPAEVADPGTDQRIPVLISRAATTTDDESISVSDPDPGLYYVRVYFGNGDNSYNLLWDDNLVDLAGDENFTDDDFVFARSIARGLASPSANDDGDPYPNWAEYALALDSAVRDELDLGSSIGMHDGKRYFQFEFVRSSEAAAAGYGFTVLESEDLDFVGANTAVYVDSEVVAPGVEKVIFRSSEPIEDIPSCFFRLVVTPPEKSF